MKLVTIAFTNQKGGIGKTTDTRELGIYLASIGKKVLLIDADPQGNLTKSLSEEPELGLYELFIGEDYILEEIVENLSLLTGDSRMTYLEKMLVGEIDCFTRLRSEITNPIFQRFEIILIDCPPSLGMLTTNALVAADYFIIPMAATLYCMQGTNDLMENIQKIRKSLNASLKLLGVIINCFDKLPAITREIRKEIIESFREQVFAQYISRTIRMEESINSRIGITGMKNKAGEEVKSIGNELLKRLEEKWEE